MVSHCPCCSTTLSVLSLFLSPLSLFSLSLSLSLSLSFSKKAYRSREDFHALSRTDAEGLEDGTLPFLQILTLQAGFDSLERVQSADGARRGMALVCEHTFALARYTHERLLALRHHNGQPVVHSYAETDFTTPAEQGAIVNFNLRRADGTWVGFAEVDKMASLFNVRLRTGCFCNTGTCHDALGISHDQLRDYLQRGYACGNDRDLVDGQPTGSVRVSFGYMSVRRDADAFLAFIDQCFVERTPAHDHLAPLLRGLAITRPSETELAQPESVDPDFRATLTHIAVYPIKSCGAFTPSAWSIGPKASIFFWYFFLNKRKSRKR